MGEQTFTFTKINTGLPMHTTRARKFTVSLTMVHNKLRSLDIWYLASPSGPSAYTTTIMQISCEVTSLRVCYVVLSVHCCLVANCLERADLLALICDVFIEFLSLSHVVTWVRCGTRVYRFLIFVTFSYFVTSYCGLGRLKSPKRAYATFTLCPRRPRQSRFRPPWTKRGDRNTT